MFVGANRHAIVDRLVADFDAVQSDQGPRVVVLSSPPGWGKTRIVQELYRRLADQQPAPAYWPKELVGESGLTADSVEMAELLAARKKVYPPELIVPSGAAMPWMWWGILCNRRGDGSFAQAMFDDATQLQAHAHGLQGALPGASATFDLGSALLGVLGIVGLAMNPVAGAAITLGGAAKAAWQHRSIAGDMKQRLSQRGHDLSLDASSGGRDSDLDEMANGLARLSRARPMVIVVDDAHDADDTLLDVLGRLVTARARVLIVATAWPSLLADASSDIARPFAAWLESVERTAPGVVRREVLEPLQPADVIAVAEFDCPEVAAQSDEVVNLFGENLLAVRSALRLSTVRRELARGKRADLKRYERDPDAVFSEYWDELPEPVRHVLALAASVDTHYVPEIIATAAMAAGIHDAREAIDRGATVYEWTRLLDTTLHAFVEPMLFSIAKSRGVDQQLIEDDLQVLRQTIRDAVDDEQLLERLSPSSRLTLWRHHVALVERGLLPADQAASFSAGRVAMESRERYHYHEAIRLLERALDWTELPVDCDWCLSIRFNLARDLQEVGRSAEALVMLKQLLLDEERVLGVDHPLPLDTRNMLALAQAGVGLTAEALATFERLLLDCERVLGSEDLSTLGVRGNRASQLASAGRVGEAIDAIEDLLPDSMRLLGPDHPVTLSSRNELAVWLAESGRVGEALEVLEALLIDVTKSLGGEHPIALAIRNNLGLRLAESGRVGEALEVLEAILQDSTQVLGKDHPYTIKCCANLARQLSKVGRTDEAMRFFERLLPDAIRVLGADHPTTLKLRGDVAYELANSGCAEESLSMYEALHLDQTKVLGVHHPKTQLTRKNVAGCLKDLGRFEEALLGYEALLADQIQVIGLDHPETLTTRNDLAFCLLEAGQVEESLVHFEVLCQEELRVHGADHSNTLRARGNVAMRLAQLGRLAEAKAAFESLRPDLVRLAGEDNQWVQMTDSALEEIRLAMEDRDALQPNDHE